MNPGVQEVFDIRRFKPMDMTMDVIRIIVAIIIPPLGVFLQVGLGGHFWLNLLLTLLGYVPGVVHALWVILHYPRRAIPG